MRQNLYVFSLYHNPDIEDRIFPCLLTSMAAVRAEDVHASFLFVGDLNSPHQECLGSTTTNRHGVAAFNFATVSSCEPLVVGPTYACGGTLELLMTEVPNLVLIAVVAPIGNSDRSSLFSVISMGQAVPNYCVSIKIFLTDQVNWNTCCGAINDLNWNNIYHDDNTVDVLDICNCWMDVMYQHRPSVCATRINLSMMINAGVLLASKQGAHLRWTRDRSRVNWEGFVCCQVRANETYSEDKHLFSDSNRYVFMNVQFLICGGPLNSAAFGSSSSLPLLVDGGG